MPEPRQAPAWDWSAAGYFDFIYLSQAMLGETDLTMTDEVPFLTGLTTMYFLMGGVGFHY